jgi:DNA ligase-1
LKISDKSFIIDGEAVAYYNGKILPFKLLSTRKRKNVDKIEVKICVFVFDILYFDNRELLNESLERRRKILHDNFIQDEIIKFADGQICKLKMRLMSISSRHYRVLAKV